MLWEETVILVGDTAADSSVVCLLGLCIWRLKITSRRENIIMYNPAGLYVIFDSLCACSCFSMIKMLAAKRKKRNTVIWFCPI